MIFNELFRKWFGLDPRHCESCDILREQLNKSEAERIDLLHRLLDKDKAEPSAPPMGELKPILPQNIPWRVRQQMLEAEDRAKAKLMREKQAEIDELEKEVGING